MEFIPFLAFSHREQDAIVRALRRAGIAHHYAESPGGHDWGYWSATLEHTLRFFGGVLHATEDDA